MKEVKKIKKYVCLMLVALCALTACNNTTTYSRQLDAEKEVIKQFIERNQLNILTQWPDSGYMWSEKDYVQVPGEDYFYYHLVEAGDVESDTITYSDQIIFRFRKYTLEQYADTISYWSTMDGAEPVAFTLSNYSSSEWASICACEGVAKALKYMNHKNAEAKIICPSKMGIVNDGNSVTPYCYDLKIKGIKK